MDVIAGLRRPDTQLSDGEDEWQAIDNVRFALTHLYTKMQSVTAHRTLESRGWKTPCSGVHGMHSATVCIYDFVPRKLKQFYIIESNFQLILWYISVFSVCCRHLFCIHT